MPNPFVRGDKEMKRYRAVNLVVSLLFMTSLLMGGLSPVSAQTLPAASLVSQTVKVPSQPSQAVSPATPNDEIGMSSGMGQMRTTTQAMRIAAALNQKQAQKAVIDTYAGINPATANMSSLGVTTNGIDAQAANAATMAAPYSPPDYFGIANWANSPLPTITNGVVSGGIRKFVDTLPGLCGVNTANGTGTNSLGQCIPVAVADQTTFAGSDYYEIAVVEYHEQLHRDLPGPFNSVPSTIDQSTKIRGYVQVYPVGTQATADTTHVALSAANGLSADVMDPVTGQPRWAYSKPQYLGPIIVAHGCELSVTGCAPIPVRVKFDNLLPTGPAGTLEIPVDPSYMGAGMGPDGTTPYTQNRATLHLHGGNSPWISDGTPHQWTTPKGETLTTYFKGDGVAYVPDMWFDANGNLIPSCAKLTTCIVAGATNDPGVGSLTFYWTNQQSGRLMFYHDHSYGITRLNVYAGEAAGYLLVDDKVDAALATAGVPGTSTDLEHLIPLVIQDKTFVPDNGVAGGQLAATDPTWDVAKNPAGSLWFPHVYTPNQNPADMMGANAYGRWDYGPWFWPPQDPSTFPAANQPYQCTSLAYPGGAGLAFPPLMCPGFPNPSGTPEAFMDTPVLNGQAYPSLTVDPTAYQFQILAAGNDRTWNLGFYKADPMTIGITNGGAGYNTAALPAVTFTPAISGVTATPIISGGTVTGVMLTNVGKGYSAAPLVTINGLTCTPNGTTCVVATASATFDPITGTVTGVKVTNGGAGYVSATVAINDPTVAPSSCTTTCTGATADAVVTPMGVILSVTLAITPGTVLPASATVSIAPPSCTLGTSTCAQAYAVVSFGSEVKMVDAVPHNASSTLPLCTAGNPVSGANLVTGLTDARGPINGTGLPAACYPQTWPTDGRDGGVPDPTTAGPAFVEIGTEAGLLPSPVVIPPSPVGYEYNRRSITVLNVYNHGLLIGPAERSDVVVDFSQFAGQDLILYNDAPAPVPAFDSRNDYYTGDPDQTDSGGAPTTLPGYGPNTRTIMKVHVNATVLGPQPKASFNLATLQAAQPGIFSASQLKMIVPEPAFNGTTSAAANATYVPIQATQLNAWIGGVGGLTLNNGGSGYAKAPTVAINGGGGTGATASLTFTGAFVNGLTLTNGGTGFTGVPTVVFNNTNTNGAGAAATATITRVVNTITITNGGRGYTTAPTVTISAPATGVRATATAGITGGVVSSITITNKGSGYTTTPTVTFSAPPPGGNRAAATAALTGVVNSLLLTNAGSGYVSAPTISFTGNGGTGAAATATILPGTVTSLLLTNAGTGYTSQPTVDFTPAANTPNPTTPASATANPPATPLQPKAIQELFTLDYGRMNATLGVEVPFTSFFTQTTIPYGYIDPPTELLQSGQMQIWKITHNGVDTHFIHFHLFNVQVLNRVGWDGMIKPPDANEVGWKDTVRMNPLEDVIVALLPMNQQLPWDLPNSVRNMDVTMPAGTQNANNTPGFANIDPNNNPATVVNNLVNFGYEYVWHCHILGHEENDMMRPMILAVPPQAPTNVVAARSGSGNSQRVTITWKDNSLHESGYTIQRATSQNGPWLDLTAPAVAGSGGTGTYVDTTIRRRTTYFYRVVADNLVGYTQDYGTVGVGYPTLDATSAAINAAPSSITTLSVQDEIGPIFADGFETGLEKWSGQVGDVATTKSKHAVVGESGGAQAMVATLGNGAPSYVFDTTPNGQSHYDASFYFDGNGATASDSPVDIFVALDQSNQPLFGVQYQSLTGSDYQLRAWAMIGGQQVFTDWKSFTYPTRETDDKEVADKTGSQPHRIEVSWEAGDKASFNFYVDDTMLPALKGDTGASTTVSEALLGPSLGVTAASSGAMYFDEFASSSVSVSQGTLFTFLPMLHR